MTTRRSKAGRASAARLEAAAASVEDVAAGEDVIRPARREEMMPIALGAVLASFLALYVCFTKGYTLLYGDAVAHLGIARRILDSRNPGLVQLGGVWLPLPHLLMLPFVQKMEWWQNGLAGAWPSLACYILGAVGFYKLARRMLTPRWALAAAVFYMLNPNLLYLSTTAMTEPLFLALLVWITVLAVEFADAVSAGRVEQARWRLPVLGGLVLAAVLTRYDGWVLGAVAWCVVVWTLVRGGDGGRKFANARRRLMPAFALFTVLCVAGPLLWFWYNQHFRGDPLDFIRGPYSAAAIERRTTPKGAGHYPGWHSPLTALKLYTRAAQLDAAVWEMGFVLLLAAVAGSVVGWRKRLARAALVMLWLPLGFYVYSVAFGSVPIFIPPFWPHSYYNSRYGMELLPALVLYTFVGAAALEVWLAERAESWAKLTAKLLQPVLLGLGVLNAIGMTYRGPLVLKEALANSPTRVGLEQNLARMFGDFQPGAPILIRASDYIGALQNAGIPLRQTINEMDGNEWQAALADPAGRAAYVIAFAGDEVSKAVTAHPEDLEEMTILCTTGQPCVRIYKSNRFGVIVVPHAAPAPLGGR